MSHLVPFNKVQKLLKNCANGHSIRTTKHNKSIKYNNKSYQAFPKHNEIEIGHVKSLIKSLNIDQDCAKKYVNI